MDRLGDIGFERVGQWHLASEDLQLSLERWGEISPALYAFAMGGVAMYIGKTAQSLRQRLYGYVKPGSTQRTNIRVRRKIVEALQRGHEVQVYAFKDSGLQKYGSFKINLAAALEDDLIRQLSPPWNGAERPQSPDHAASLASTRTRPEAVGLAHQRQGGEASPLNGPRRFRVRAGVTYRSNGFFNVPTRFSNLFGHHGAEIAILCEGHDSPIAGKINRTSNRSETPRIFGGSQLRHWLQENVPLGQEFMVDVAGPCEIRLASA